MAKYKVLESFELAGATPNDTSVMQEIGSEIELTDEQAAIFVGKVEVIAEKTEADASNESTESTESTDKGEELAQ